MSVRMLSDELREACGALDESYPDAVRKVLGKLGNRWKKLWSRAREEGLDTLRTRDKYLFMQALEKAAAAAGYTTPAIKARVVDQAMAWTTPY